MSRTTQHRRVEPRPGAAKLKADLDKKIEEESGNLAELLVSQFLMGSRAAMNIIAMWAQDADFGQKCEKVHGKTLSQLLQQIESEQKQAEAEQAASEGAETDACSELEPGSTESDTAAA